MGELPVDQQVSMIQYLIRIGVQNQLLTLASGVVFILISSAALLFIRNRNLIAGFGLMSLMPGILAVTSLTHHMQQFHQLAIAATPPKPAAFAEAVSGIISAGFWGLLMTIIPAGLFMIALLKSPSSVEQTATEFENHSTII